jgi:hypothetical protein
VPRTTLPTRESEISEEEERRETMGNYNAVYTLLCIRGARMAFSALLTSTLCNRGRGFDSSTNVL